MTREEALGVVRNWGYLTSEKKEALETLIPELKKDDKERIKENCIHFLELQKSHHASTVEIDECIDWLKGLVPSEWSKDDEYVRVNLIEYLEGKTRWSKIKERGIDWLNSLRDRVLSQPKQEWSEEDEHILNNIYDFVAENLSDKNRGVCADECLKWLKSLRPQTTWKPSGEQMEALERMVNFAHFNEVDNRDIVRNLLSQLKKLMEE